MSNTLLFLVPTVLVLLVVGVLLWGVVIYNRLVARRQQVAASGAQVDVQLKRRHDLVPNLVETVRGYAVHERGTFEAVTAARGSAVAALGGPREPQAQAEAALGGALSRLLAIGEAYPDLRASATFHALQSELADTEDKIAYARQFLNGSVQGLNTAVQSFPSSVVAGLTGFGPAEYFRAADEDRGPVAVRF
ncbi:LemA family protein [Kineosporia sp. A_224]|uniref:LemA family protein n=1 Tax=Kineosporia sp. A_224 TaxID=1962180 RepID=UPI000B4A6DA1|nr:LemA family protein [Kineosporia sp. A_224]